MTKKPNILLLVTDQQRGDCLGVDGHFAQHWDFRLEADYMIFAAFDVVDDNFDDTVRNPSGGAPSQQTVYHYNAKYSPTVARVAMGMAYRF